MRLIIALACLLSLSGCEFVQGAMAYCSEAAAAVDLVCNYSPILIGDSELGDFDGVTDLQNPGGCLIFEAPGKQPIMIGYSCPAQ